MKVPFGRLRSRSLGNSSQRLKFWCRLDRPPVQYWKRPVVGPILSPTHLQIINFVNISLCQVSQYKLFISKSIRSKEWRVSTTKPSINSANLVEISIIYQGIDSIKLESVTDDGLYHPSEFGKIRIILSIYQKILSKLINWKNWKNWAKYR